MQGVDELGLDKVDRAVLGTMMDKFGGGRSGWTPSRRQPARMP